MRPQAEIDAELLKEATQHIGEQRLRIRKLEAALAWIAQIADANYEQDEKLRSQGARTLARISDKASAALSEKSAT